MSPCPMRDRSRSASAGGAGRDRAARRNPLRSTAPTGSSSSRCRALTPANELLFADFGELRVQVAAA